MMPEVTPIMLTLAILWGCVLLGLILQVLNHVQIRKLEQKILEQQNQLIKHIIPQNFTTLEDMISQDLQRQISDSLLDRPLNEGEPDDFDPNDPFTYRD